MTRADFTHCIPALPVADVVATQDYYRDVLGFQVDWCDGKAWGAVSAGGISLFFQRVDDPPRGLILVLNAENADALHELYRARGAEIVNPIGTRPYGMRDFDLCDPNGHILRIGHTDESQADYSGFEFEDPPSIPGE